MPFSVQMEEIVRLKKGTVDTDFRTHDCTSKARVKNLSLGKMSLKVWLERKKNCHSEFKGWKREEKRERE